MKVLITGSLGLVGSECVNFFLQKGYEVVGIDSNRRELFFGKDGDVSMNTIKNDNYISINGDITNIIPTPEHYERAVGGYFDSEGKNCLVSIQWLKDKKFDLIIHAAAQPSHDFSASHPRIDFDNNAMGTFNMLEFLRLHAPRATFIYASTNKVYGDRPNKISFNEGETRYVPVTSKGIDETMSIDKSTHSPFGVSKLYGDIATQEWGRYFGLKTGVFRCGCITGKAHAGAELHGFLAYIGRCKREGRKYKIYGYKGKQVRDNIHAYDLANAFYHYSLKPRYGEVYNMGGGSARSISVLEALDRFGITDYEYIDQHRKGDHIWYVSNVNKFRLSYPSWDYTYNMEKIIEDIIST